MYELEELRKKILDQDYIAALAIVDQLEEMSKEDKLNKIYSYLVILLIHLIKQQAENRTTRSWDRSIENSVDNINRTNKRRKSKGYYAPENVMQELIDEAFPRALREASYEAFEGKFTPKELSNFVDAKEIKNKAFSILKKHD